MNLIIEKAKEQDAKTINKLFSMLLEDDRMHYDHNIKENLEIKDFFEKRINLEETILLVAKNNDEIIGYIYGIIRYDNKIKKDLESIIDYLFVLKEYRNKKVGTKLINEFVKISKEKQVKYVFIENKYSNKIASNLYSKLGFDNFIETRRIEI